MNKKRIYLSSPHMSGKEKKYIEEALDSNWVAPLGPHVDAFENEVSDYAGVKCALAVNSGTAAVHLALRLSGVGKGDVVFTSTLTFVASANPILYQGAIPVFIDSEPNSWNISNVALERALLDYSKKGLLPKAVIVVNLYGQSADMDPIIDICNRFGVTLIEDAAESMGATYKGKKSGSIGKYGIYSFNGNKIITSAGGGMLISNDSDALQKARFWTTQARDPFRHYQHSEIGYNYRMSNLLAAVGRAQLEVLDKRVDARRAVFHRYYEALSTIGGIAFMPELTCGRSTRWLTVFTIDPLVCGINRDKIIDALEAENIEARPVWKPMHLQPLYATYDYYTHGKNFSISDKLYKHGICLPSGSNLEIEAQDKIINIIKGCII